MSAGMPELGSKISLISKADIRYEGRLFTVDPQECTIALASVRSFGTEDRDTQFPVAPQNQVYDYILFRGSDIKDIRVVNSVPSLPNDPAIMQLSVPPSLGQQTYQPQGFSHPVLGPMGPQMGQYNTPYGALGSLGGLPNAMAPGIGMNRDMRTVSKQQSTSVLDLIGGGSRSTTPVSLISRKSPTMDQSVQAGGQNKDEKKTVQRPIQPPTQRNSQSRERRESRGEHQDQRQNQRPQQRNQHQYPNQQYQHQQHQHHQHHQQQNNQHHQQHQQQNHGGNRGGGGWINRGNNMRQRGRGGRGVPQGMFRPPPGNPQNTGPGQKPRNTLKFDNDYDFEQANTEFEELRSQLAKVKITEENKTPTTVATNATTTTTTTTTTTEVNGDSEKKDDSGNETGAGEGEHEEEPEIYYDKAKSFFDNISCEAVERSKGRSQRTDWRTERKLNSETFGVASTRRGLYRGRGGYYNRGNMYRGGYRGNYRGQGQHQPRQNMRQNQGNQPPTNQPPPVAAVAGK